MSANFNDPAANAPDAAAYKGKGKAEDPSVEMSMDEEESEESENENEELVSSKSLWSNCQNTAWVANVVFVFRFLKVNTVPPSIILASISSMPLDGPLNHFLRDLHYETPLVYSRKLTFSSQTKTRVRATSNPSPPIT